MLHMCERQCTGRKKEKEYRRRKAKREDGASIPSPRRCAPSGNYRVEFFGKAQDTFKKETLPETTGTVDFVSCQVCPAFE